MESKSVILVPYDSRMSLGMGYDLATGDVRGQAIDMSEALAPQPPFGNQNLPRVNDNGEISKWPHGQVDLEGREVTEALSEDQKLVFFDSVYAPFGRVDYSLTFIESRKELRDVMGVDGKMALDHEKVTASVQGKYANTDVNNEQSTKVAAKCSIRTFVETLDVNKVSVDWDNIKNPHTGDLDENFVTRFGSAFCQSIIYGGELTMLMDIELKDGEKSTDIKVAGQIEVPIGSKKGKDENGDTATEDPEAKKQGVSAELDLGMAINNMTKDRNVSIDVSCLGGRIVQIPSKPMDFMEVANKFLATVVGLDGNPAPVRVSMFPYQFLKGWQSRQDITQQLSSGLTDLLVDYFLDLQEIARELGNFQDAAYRFDDPVWDERIDAYYSGGKSIDSKTIASADGFPADEPAPGAAAPTGNVTLTDGTTVSGVTRKKVWRKKKGVRRVEFPGASGANGEWQFFVEPHHIMHLHWILDMTMRSQTRISRAIKVRKSGAQVDNLSADAADVYTRPFDIRTEWLTGIKARHIDLMDEKYGLQVESNVPENTVGSSGSNFQLVTGYAETAEQKKKLSKPEVLFTVQDIVPVPPALFKMHIVDFFRRIRVDGLKAAAA